MTSPLRLLPAVVLPLLVVALLSGCGESEPQEPACNGASCVCEAEQSCEVEPEVCGPESCSVDCSDNSACEGSCGASCSVDCSMGTNCTLTVGPSSSVSCGPEASCSITCTGSCSVSCAEAELCELTCPGDDQPKNILEGGACEG